MLKYCFIFMIGYASLENIYRQLTNGELTTLEQSIITFIWTPIIIKHFTIIKNKKYRILLFPFNIWLCEIIFGNLLLYYNNTRAWYYDDILALFNGLITLSFTLHWILLGLIIDTFLYFYPYQPIKTIKND